MITLSMLLLFGAPSIPLHAERPDRRAIDPTIHSGKSGQTVVRPPRLEGASVVDGVLDEPMWRQAAILTGFSQFSPIDGAPAADSTDVRVWYSATALHIGIRAFDGSGAIHATLANRDQIFSDDNVQLLLSTFNDGRQATVFAVNPLGVQADGAMNESGRSNGIGGREGIDLSQDFVWQSKGRVTAEGFDVEMVIPFKSIRFQQARTQTWGINIVRVVQRSGQEQTWTPAKRGAASFLSQSGRLEGLTDLFAGHVLDIVPTMTTRVDGAAPAPGESWDYSGGKPQFGGNVRYGITPNLTLNATAHPDFSQVEGDVAQFSFDPRQAIAFPERRPFFLDGTEQFDAPSNLIYTRRIVQPVFATKLTGKVRGMQIGVLGALDDRIASRYDEHPKFGVLRMSRDLGPGSRLGFTWTQQQDGVDDNRVFDLDGRMVLGKIHSFTFSGAIAHDDRSGVVKDAPLWSAGYRRSGRNFRQSFNVSGVHSDFRTRSGFVSRTGIANSNFTNTYTWLRPTKTLEAFTSEILLEGHWTYDNFVHGGKIQDRLLHFNFNSRFKGGWNIGANVFEETFGYDPALFANVGILQPDGSVTPFPTQKRIHNRDYVISGNTPSLKHVNFNWFLLWGHDENFYEWASANILWFSGGITFRPSDKVRLNASWNLNKVNRRTDGTRVDLTAVPYTRLEYQISRAVQIRLVTQYSLATRDALRDNSRTELPLVFLNGQGGHTPSVATRNGNLRTDFLFTYLPGPGTVVYLGYGSAMHEPDDLGRRTLTRTQDGLFMKLSYLWRMRG